MKIQIKHRVTGRVLFEGDYESTKEAVLAALKGGAYLGGADLRGADLRGAYLRGAYLGGADLGGADLGGAYLGGADLRGADLRGADLRGADLGGAYLRGAYLRGAYLGGAYLGGAKIDGGVEISLIPHQIDAGQYFVYIWDKHIKIGCEFHSMNDWFGFDDRKILAMDNKKGLEWWRIWKEPIKAICINTGRWTETEQEANENPD